MTTELLLEGANAYTSLTEIATTPEADTPEAIPLTTIVYSIFATYTIAAHC